LAFIQKRKMSLPHDYAERVYAGVLGKIIGVYLGRPFEGWTYEQILERLGKVDYYVNDKIAAISEEIWGHDYVPPILVTDDDISGTFTFLRAMPDYGNSLELTPAQIGQTWLNYIIENRTILWWGGLGNSTEHTAYLRLKNGIPAPESGSIARNGKIVAEQIGAQIFIDGWAMVAPADPELAADLARRAASVSHDGEAIYGAQVLAAMESQAFVESDIHKLLDVGISMIPKDAVIYRMIADLRDWQAAEPDWHKTFAEIQSTYSYDQFGGNVHIVPNHALIILGLLYSDDDFQTAMKVVNTAGWDTDCNSGNLGCLLGIKNGLAGLDLGPNWRGPVADRIYLSTADGGRSITDAVNETLQVVEIGSVLKGETHTWPKGGARFNFEFPGSVQGFQPEEETTRLENVLGHSQLGNRSLRIQFKDTGNVATPTFILPEELDLPGYQLLASPTLYSGQTIRAGLEANTELRVRLSIWVYNAFDQLDTLYGPEFALEAGTPLEAHWIVPGTHGQPIAQIGLQGSGNPDGVLYLDYLTWEGEPDITLSRPADCNDNPQIWRRAWVDGMDQWQCGWPQSFRLAQNEGRGLIIQGTREWRNYEVSARIRPTLAAAAGIGARVQGMRRYYALLLVAEGKAQLVKALDGDKVLTEVDFHWEVEMEYKLCLQVDGPQLRGWVNEQLLFEIEDESKPLMGGGVAFVLEEGHMMSEAMRVQPA
jgi:ADP-ribosylglycohydrolase